MLYLTVKCANLTLCIHNPTVKCANLTLCIHNLTRLLYLIITVQCSQHTGQYQVPYASKHGNLYNCNEYWSLKINTTNVKLLTKIFSILTLLSLKMLCPLDPPLPHSALWESHTKITDPDKKLKHNVVQPSVMQYYKSSRHILALHGRLERGTVHCPSVWQTWPQIGPENWQKLMMVEQGQWCIILQGCTHTPPPNFLWAIISGNTPHSTLHSTLNTTQHTQHYTAHSTLHCTLNTTLHTQQYTAHSTLHCTLHTTLHGRRPW